MSTLLEMRIDELEEKTAALMAERDALAATVEALKLAGTEALKYLIYPAKRSSGAQESYEKLSMAVEATPQQHLAEIRAQAVSSCADKLGDAFILPHNLRKETQKAEFYKAGWRDAFLFIKQYAASIRQEGHQTWLRDSNVKSACKVKGGEISDLEDEE